MENSTQRESRFSRSRHAADNAAMNKIADAVRMEFLRALDSAPFEVTDWEAEFIECALVWRLPFTQKMRDRIDGLRLKYQPKVKTL